MDDREKILKGFDCCYITGSCHFCPYWNDDTCITDLNADVMKLLQEQPEQKFFVDSDGKMTPLPVQKHGHWIRPPKFISESQCSVCKETYVGDYRTFKFCPGCGARMDEEVKQE